VAYKDGKRVPLEQAGITETTQQQSINENKSNPVIENRDKDKLEFKIQLGVFKNDPPEEFKSKISKIKGVSTITTLSGMTQYTAGSFKTYKEATLFRDEIIKKYNIDDAFVVSYYDKQLISTQEALELLK
jgi:cell division protein FtsN